MSSHLNVSDVALKINKKPIRHCYKWLQLQQLFLYPAIHNQQTLDIEIKQKKLKYNVSYTPTISIREWDDSFLNWNPSLSRNISWYRLPMRFMFYFNTNLFNIYERVYKEINPDRRYIYEFIYRSTTWNMMYSLRVLILIKIVFD